MESMLFKERKDASCFTANDFGRGFDQRFGDLDLHLRCFVFDFSLVRFSLAGFKRLNCSLAISVLARDE
jgi:hypothetical protein